MPDKTPLEIVPVAVVIVRCDDEFLVMHNPKWKEFSLPMTKRRTWSDKDFEGKREEDWVDAAARAAFEAVGSAVTGTDLLPVVWEPIPGEQGAVKEIRDVKQGDRDGVVKSYRFRLFALNLEAKEHARGVDAILDWWSRADFDTMKPVSPTARKLIAEFSNARTPTPPVPLPKGGG